MKTKQKLKIVIDIGMTALLFCQMAYMLISEEEVPTGSSFAEYLAMMCLWACLSYYLLRGIQRLSAKKKNKGE